jgi:hypothetical protein
MTPARRRRVETRGVRLCGGECRQSGIRSGEPREIAPRPDDPPRAVASTHAVRAGSQPTARSNAPLRFIDPGSERMRSRNISFAVNAAPVPIPDCTGAGAGHRDEPWLIAALAHAELSARGAEAQARQFATIECADLSLITDTGAVVSLCRGRTTGVECVHVNARVRARGVFMSRSLVR